MEPSTTYGQTAVLAILKDERWLSGKGIRDLLLDGFSIEQAGPGFYQMMARMEKAKLVKCRANRTRSNGRVVTEQQYQITNKGRVALGDFMEFNALVNAITYRKVS